MTAQDSGISIEFRSATTKVMQSAFKDVTAGIAASVVPIANIISFGALLFPDLQTGVPIAIWGMLICIGGVWIALKTSLPPMASGMDSPTVAVLATVSTIAGTEMMAAGATQEAAVQSVMLIFLAATVISGALLFAVGTCRLGAYLRFVPYCVVAGFLAAAGCLLIAGGVRLVTGQAPLVTALNTDWSQADLLKLGTAIAVLLVLMAIRRWVKWVFGFPVALLATWAIAAVALRWLELPDKASWYLSAPKITGWSVFSALHTSALNWSMVPLIASELMVVVVVSFTSLIAKITSIEVARGVSGDLDRELRSHGIASLIAVPFGGLGTSVQPATSLLLEHAGSATRISGVVSAVVLGAVAFANLKLPSIIPIVIIGALVFYLGLNFIIDTLWRLYRQHAWLDFALALVIMTVCLRLGYLVGVLIGLLCSCVIFAINYARIGVLRRQATRANFSSYVEHSPEASKYLREHGDAIRVYWLSGYLFFGSSEGVFELIRRDIESPSSQKASPSYSSNIP
jgi:SulP family sulfate permease